METEEVLADILNTVDVLTKVSADGEALFSQLAAFLTAKESGAELLDTLLESAAEKFGDENLPKGFEDLQEEVYTGEILPDSEEYAQLKAFLYQFHLGPGLNTGGRLQKYRYRKHYWNRVYSAKPDTGQSFLLCRRVVSGRK